MSKRVISILLILTIIMVAVAVFMFSSYINHQWYAQQLICAIECNDYPALERLLAKHGNIDAKPHIIGIDIVNDPPLHVACRSGQYEMVALLVEHGADINNSNATNRKTPLMAALSSPAENRCEIAKYLIDQGADITKRNYADSALAMVFSFNTEPYDPLVEQQEFDLAMYLIAHGADIENPGGTGNLIFYAAYHNNALMLEHLIQEEHTDINLRQERYGYTPLIYAAMGDANNAAEYLVENGADCSLQDNEGRTALDIAIEKQNLELIALFSLSEDEI